MPSGGQAHGREAKTNESRSSFVLDHLIRAQAASGLSIKAFRAEQKLSLHQFYKWNQRLRKEARSQLPASGFIELVPSANEPASPIRIRITDQIWIEVSEGFHPPTLLSVIQTVCRAENLPCLPLSAITHIYLYRSPCDMRRSFDGLCGLIRSELRADPLSGSLFVFCNRRRNMVKILYFEGEGLAIWMKSLEQGFFRPPDACAANGRIDRRQLMLLLEGVVPKKVNKRYITQR